MLKSKITQEETPAAPAITPDLLSQLRKEDMKQAIVERFSVRAEAPAPRSAVRSGARSPYWQPADDEC
jgi:hypothetical protein